MPGEHSHIPTDVLPRTVPSDPRAAEDERAVREAVERLTAERDRAMRVLQGRHEIPFPYPVHPPREIDWDEFDRAVDELSGGAARALLKQEARWRAEGRRRTAQELTSAL